MHKRDIMYNITINLGGVPVELSFSYAHRLDIYDEFLTSELPAAFAAVSEDEIAAARKFYDDGATDAYIEE